MANNWILSQEIDLQRGVQAPQVWPDALILCGDSNAHTWRVTILDDGKPAALSGTVTGYFIRGDDATVTVAGQLNGNVATVTLAQSCYNVEGNLLAVMRLKTSSGLLTLGALVLPVRRMLTDTLVDPANIVPSLNDLLAQIELMEKGTAAANTAATRANTAASNADAKAAAANAAASAANTAAANANAKATAADTASANAAKAAGMANVAASNADAKAQEANTAAANVTEAAGAANTAAVAANTAASNASTQASAANTAAQTANTAANSANTAANNADNKASAANTAAQAANTAADTANAAAAKIDGMAVSATGLSVGVSPTASVSDVDGHKHIVFGIPQGRQGDKGDIGPTPNISIGTVTTGSPNDQAAATITGTAENPLLNLTIPQGKPGDGNGTVTAVNGVDPDAEGNVTLDAAAVGATPEVYQINLTSAELDALTTQQRAKMYADGTRMIRVTLGGEAVLMMLSDTGAVQQLMSQTALGGLSFAVNADDGGLDLTYTYDE